ncbi:MAG: hypothetical protein Q9170_003151 [Blastenia crenularia]
MPRLVPDTSLGRKTAHVWKQVTLNDRFRARNFQARNTNSLGQFIDPERSSSSDTVRYPDLSALLHAAALPPTNPRSFPRRCGAAAATVIVAIVVIIIIVIFLLAIVPRPTTRCQPLLATSRTISEAQLRDNKMIASLRNIDHPSLPRSLELSQDLQIVLSRADFHTTALDALICAALSPSIKGTLMVEPGDCGQLRKILPWLASTQGSAERTRDVFLAAAKSHGSMQVHLTDNSEEMKETGKSMDAHTGLHWGFHWPNWSHAESQIQQHKKIDGWLDLNAAIEVDLRTGSTAMSLASQQFSRFHSELGILAQNIIVLCPTGHDQVAIPRPKLHALERSFLNTLHLAILDRGEVDRFDTCYHAL